MAEIRTPPSNQIKDLEWVPGTLKPSVIKNPEAYFGTMVRNSYKDEYRANDNFFKYISSVGDEGDIQQECLEPERSMEYDTDFIEQRLSEVSVENWLLFMENQRLHKALCVLPENEIGFLFELSLFKYNCKKFADTNGISKQAVSKRFRRLKNIIRKSMEKGCPK